MPDGPVSGRHPDGEPCVPYTADDLATQTDRIRVMVEPHRLTLHTDDPGQFLTAEWTTDGVQVAGRIHIDDPAVADKLAAFITREADDDA